MQCVSRIKQQLGNGRPPHFCQLLVQSEPNGAGTAALAPSVVPDETLAVDLEHCRSLILNLRSFSQFLREIFTAPGQPTPAIIGAAVQVLLVLHDATHVAKYKGVASGYTSVCPNGAIQHARVSLQSALCVCNLVLACCIGSRF